MIIISAFPGTGKTHFFNTVNSSCVPSDSDSSEFSWVKDEHGDNTTERNPDFPWNYVDHIETISTFIDVILVSSHKEVREELAKRNLPFVLVYPYRDQMTVYRDRFRERGSSEEFIKLMWERWDEFIDSCEEQKGCIHVRVKDEFISDIVKY